MTEKIYDLMIIGGGVNGCGIARDAAGRGLQVCLVEKDDLAMGTSSSSTKLFHGGLRYLEYFEFRLVREALIEREALLTAMPHISWPLRFVLPVNPDLNYKDDNSSLGKVLRYVMPFWYGRRPAILTRIGLFVYDYLGGRKILPASRSINLKAHKAGSVLKEKYKKGFEYSDCWVEDSRLVVLNARDAKNRGAEIKTRTKLVSAKREDGLWICECLDMVSGETIEMKAKGLVNCGGPWVEEITNSAIKINVKEGVRLVRGSHIITKKLFNHDQPYFLQQNDGRIIFAIPYETDYTLIGTTDLDHNDPLDDVACTKAEKDYLINAVNCYFEAQITDDDIVWHYAGVRPLYNDNASSATAATREYVLNIHDENGQAPVLMIYGGKITTYRKLAEAALAKLSPYFAHMKAPWTKGVALPGGDFPHHGVQKLVQDLMKTHEFLDDAHALRLVKAYGTDSFDMLKDCQSKEDLGEFFGWNLYEKEVRWLIKNEWVITADDLLWRRTKLGLRLTKDEQEKLIKWLETQ